MKVSGLHHHDINHVDFEDAAHVRTVRNGPCLVVMGLLLIIFSHSRQGSSCLTGRLYSTQYMQACQRVGYLAANQSKETAPLPTQAPCDLHICPYQFHVLLDAVKTGGFQISLSASMKRFPLIFSFSFCRSRCSRIAFERTIM